MTIHGLKRWRELQFVEAVDGLLEQAKQDMPPGYSILVIVSGPDYSGHALHDEDDNKLVRATERALVDIR